MGIDRPEFLCQIEVGGLIEDAFAGVIRHDLFELACPVSGLLFELISKKKKMGYTTFYRIMKKLETSGHLKLVPKKQDNGGKTTLVYKMQ